MAGTLCGDPMPFQSTLRGTRYHFANLRELLAKANEEKYGDNLAGIAAISQRERAAAKWALAEVSLREIVEQPLIDPDQDEVSRLLLESHDAAKFMPLAGLTVGEFRERLLDDATDEQDLRSMGAAIVP